MRIKAATSSGSGSSNNRTKATKIRGKGKLDRLSQERRWRLETGTGLEQRFYFVDCLIFASLFSLDVAS